MTHFYLDLSIIQTKMVMAMAMISIHPSIHTLKNSGLKTTQLGLFGNPVQGKYWTEHMLGYFDPAGWVKRFNPPCWVV